MAKVVKNTFTYRFSHGGEVTVPAGARLTRNYFEDNGYWVDPSVFPKHSIERHDADHYGIRVHETNAEEYEA